MSDLDLPPAAFEITPVRLAVQEAAAPTRAVPAGLTAFAIAALALIATLLFVGLDTGIAGNGTAVLVAIGVAGTGALFALFVVLPLQVAVRAGRRRLATARSSVEQATSGLRGHLASLGYAIPVEVARDWVSFPESSATVPLVHDSVIAARWWRPAAGDDRVFVEPFVRMGDDLTSLPVLPPLKPGPAA